MVNFLRSLLSRKLLLALGSFLTFVASGQYDLALYTVLAYLGVEGSADAIERYKQGSKARLSDKQAPAADDELSGEIWTGTKSQIHSDDIVDEAV